ncbi:DoxX family membrane protein [Chitinophaga sp. LS1]|uniref:DoxX family membrane protein n=1 Tax=Chitinophaga sp. LS1 TaxID=3051176 RepID=UPI002AAB84D0|nr:DoxX family membrane protein [Chitinophaga sp. LS1]WPV64258.1 hypothetical protein QQL36_20870 [Chitinophaga sp. LS1]
MKIVYYILRGLLALQFIYAGIEKLWLPFHADGIHGSADFLAFYLLLHRTGYLYFVGFFQLLCGLLLVFKKTYLLAAVMLIPLLLCLLATHVFISGNTGYMCYDTVLLGFDLLLLFSCYRRLLNIFI